MLTVIVSVRSSAIGHSNHEGLTAHTTHTTSNN